MRDLKDYSEDIYKCTKCGLCQSVCPVFEATGLETAVSRGKFTLLNGVLNGKIKFGKNMSKYLDMCLGCRACFDFCPSAISAEEIILSARQHSYKLNGVGFIKSFIISNFDSPFNLSLLKLFLNIYRKLGLYKLAENIAGLVNLKDQAYIFNSQVKENLQYKKLKPVSRKSDLKIAYFPGCIGTYVNSSVKNAVLMVLERNGFDVNISDGLSCCGIPARSAGNMDMVLKQAKNNLEKIDADIDYLITDCASCSSVWKIYAEEFDGELKEKAEILSQKAVHINQFLVNQNIYIPENASINKNITYHDPCHLRRFQGIYEEPRKVLGMIPGIKFTELQDADKCCGASGTFCAINPEISKAISKMKGENILKTKSDIVSTDCPSCKIGLVQGMVQCGESIPVYQPVELLAELYLKE